MNLTTFILFTDIIALSIYLISVLVQLGVPVHLSYTYYQMERKRKGSGRFFQGLMVLLCCTGIPTWAFMTQQLSPWSAQFIFCPFLTMVCLLAVTLTARYRKHKTIHYFHYFCATMAGVGAAVWLLGAAWKIAYITIGVMIVAVCAGLCTGTLKKGWLFWTELTTFYSILFTLFILSIHPIGI